MATMIYDKYVEQQVRENRAAAGADRHDEVWESVYMMSLLPNNEHQFIATRLARILDEIVGDNGLGQVFAGINVSDRIESWQENYRAPDVAVYLNDTSAVDHGTFWFGGPDFAIEIVSQDDLSRQKFDFYSKLNTRELLIVDRYPWQLELYQLHDGKLNLKHTAKPGDGSKLNSHTLSLSMTIDMPESDTERPRIHAFHTESDQAWTI